MFSKKSDTLIGLVARASFISSLKRLYTSGVNGIPAINEFRTSVNNPTEHNELQLANYYTISLEHKKRLFGGGGLPKTFEKQVKTFAETSLMVRYPALELMNYIRNVDFNKPVARFVLCGENGCGKTLTMAHILHYGSQSNFILVHVPWVPNWTKRPKELVNTQDGFVDLPIEAASWLLHFKTQNLQLLQKLNLKTSKDCVWSKRETTKAGSNLIELIEHGITRIKYASNAVKSLLFEIKEHAKSNRCKVMVAIDGFNAFFHPQTRIFIDNNMISPERITLTQPFLNITSYDWTNGICILSVDKLAMNPEHMHSHLPNYLLDKKGFEHLDPFVPVFVKNYTDKEFANCINYYMDRHWIQKVSDEFNDQLKFLSNKNPYYLMQLLRSL